MPELPLLSDDVQAEIDKMKTIINKIGIIFLIFTVFLLSAFDVILLQNVDELHSVSFRIKRNVSHTKIVEDVRWDAHSAYRGGIEIALVRFGNCDRHHLRVMIAECFII